MKRREFFGVAAAALTGTTLGEWAVTSSAESQRPLWQKLPRWRGFNLLEKFYRNQRFRERDFQWMSDWGFDFVRLPLDYQQWTDPDAPERFDERVLADVDEAVDLGRRYGIHVCLNLHNAPGHTVNAAVQHERSLWDNEDMQAQFAHQWQSLARRYRGESPGHVSFNLVNEPYEVAADRYVHAIRGAIEAIRAVDPQRLIISDGLAWGREPIENLKELRMAQSTRGYDPMWLSHYRASWVSGADAYPTPGWPAPRVTGRLYGTDQAQWQRPLMLEGPFGTPMALRVRVGQVSRYADLVIEADGVKVFQHTFEPAAGEGDWEQVVYAEQWGIYQNIYNRDYTATIPAGTRRVTLALRDGDWLTITHLGLRAANGDPRSSEHVLTIRAQPWGEVQEEPIRYHASDEVSPFRTTAMFDQKYLAEGLVPWRELAASGVGVHVGEWGAYRHTPHDVVLRWAEQLLELWAEAGFGWAMWNLRGSFGIVDSGRSDVAYVDHDGHQLDGQLLQLLRRW